MCWSCFIFSPFKYTNVSSRLLIFKTLLKKRLPADRISLWASKAPSSQAMVTSCESLSTSTTLYSLLKYGGKWFHSELNKNKITLLWGDIYQRFETWLIFQTLLNFKTFLILWYISWLRYGWDVAEIWKRYGWDLADMWMRYGWDMEEIWIWDVDKIWLMWLRCCWDKAKMCL